MNKRTWFLMFLTCLIGFSTLTVSCSSDDDTTEEVDEWFRDSDFTGKSRNGAAGFTINNIGYLTTGYDGTTFRKDTWSFDPATGSWNELEAFPGDARYDAAAFVIGNTAYVGSGITGSKKYSKDFYKFDATTKTWSPIAPLPTTEDGIYGAVAFSVNGKGYVGCGYSEENDWLKDFYEYNPSSDTWTKLTNFPGSKRVYGFSFVIGDKAYVGGGTNNNSYPDDFYSFDGTKWEKLQNINRNDASYAYNLTRKNPTTLVLKGQGYVVGGSTSSYLNTVWEYNPASDVWNDDNQVFQGTARDGAVGFSINDIGYITTGRFGSSGRLDDTWKFVPVK